MVASAGLAYFAAGFCFENWVPTTNWKVRNQHA